MAKKLLGKEVNEALVAALQTHSAPVQKITIIPRTSGALGYTMQVEQDNHYLMTKEEIENKIATYAGGRAAEEVALGSVSTGASNDIEQATKLARAMITRYGMSDKLGTVLYGSEHTSDEVFLGRDFSSSQDYSDDTAAKIDSEIHRIISEAYANAKRILTENMDKLHFVAEFLVRNEVMDGEQFAAAMDGNPTFEELEEMTEAKKRKSREENDRKRAELLAEERKRKEEEEKEKEEQEKAEQEKQEQEESVTLG
mgnify:CR=1 FL=1